MPEKNYRIIKPSEICGDCTSQPACRQVRKKEHARIYPGSPTCQKVAIAEEESGRR